MGASADSGLAPLAPCEACANTFGLYMLTCPACCLRLIRSTPPSSATRKAMAEHVRRSISDEAWQQLVDDATPPKHKSRAP